MNNAAVNIGVVYIFLNWCFPFSLDKYSEVKLLDHKLVLFLIFRGISILFSIVVVPVYMTISSIPGLPFSLHFCQHLWFVVFLPLVILTACSDLTVVLICTSLMVRQHINCIY